MKFLLLFLPLLAQAGFEGSISFSEAEKQAHRDSIQVVLQEAASCLKKDLNAHQDFVRKYGISKFYGDRSSFSKLSYGEKKAYLRRLGVNESLVDQLEPTSCVGLTLKCLGQGFAAAGEQDLWKRLRAYTVANGVDGTALQDGLQKLGWKILYWNPNTGLNQKWDAREKASDPENKQRFWGWHQERWNQVRTKGKYFYNYVDDATKLVNFGTNEPEFLTDIPFFVGTAHTGYHVFPGTYGRVIEGHSTRLITDELTLQTSLFSPLVEGGGPQGGAYRTGIMAVPPGYLN